MKEHILKKKQQQQKFVTVWHWYTLCLTIRKIFRIIVGLHISCFPFEFQILWCDVHSRFDVWLNGRQWTRCGAEKNYFLFLATKDKKPILDFGDELNSQSIFISKNIHKITSSPSLSPLWHRAYKLAIYESYKLFLRTVVVINIKKKNNNSRFDYGITHFNVI